MADDIVPVDRKTLDIVAFMRRRGFSVDEIELIAAVASPEVCCTSTKAYVRWLEDNRGIKMSYDYALKLRRRPEFHECVDILYTQEKGAWLKAVEKTMFNRACDTDDAHGVQAARLLMQANGMLRDGEKSGAGSVEQQFVKLVMDIRQGKIEGTIHSERRRFTVQTEDLLPEKTGPEAEDSNVVDVEFEFETEEAESSGSSETDPEA